MSPPRESTSLHAAIALVFALLIAPALPVAAATGRADVRLVRLLSDVPDSVAGADSLHNVRVRLVAGNVLVFRKDGEFAALLPIDEVGGGTDSLRYFYYVEKPSFLWVFPGARTKGIQDVADGGTLHFNSFRLLWRRSTAPGALGWIYFPNDAGNHGLRFSVVSGQSVDEVNPKDTEYWVELGALDKGGF